ncbi:hypothetical protein ACFX14_022820 [Malus domestica]
MRGTWARCALACLALGRGCNGLTLALGPRVLGRSIYHRCSCFSGSLGLSYYGSALSLLDLCCLTLGWLPCGSNCYFMALSPWSCPTPHCCGGKVTPFVSC